MDSVTEHLFAWHSVFDFIRSTLAVGYCVVFGGIPSKPGERRPFLDKIFSHSLCHRTVNTSTVSIFGLQLQHLVWWGDDGPATPLKTSRVAQVLFGADWLGQVVVLFCWGLTFSWKGITCTNTYNPTPNPLAVLPTLSAQIVPDDPRSTKRKLVISPASPHQCIGHELRVLKTLKTQQEGELFDGKCARSCNPSLMPLSA